MYNGTLVFAERSQNITYLTGSFLRLASLSQSMKATVGIALDLASVYFHFGFYSSDFFSLFSSSTKLVSWLMNILFSVCLHVCQSIYL